jgi:hypothetical protein
MPSSTEPKLAPPGAGLPAYELAIARGLFKLRRAFGSRRSFDAKFARERQRVRDLLAPLSPAQCQERVLIRRLPGLEDSSRYWSVWMTLDHLRIVHHEIARVIGALVRGELPAGEASTAAVKPTVVLDEVIVMAYEQSCELLQATIKDAPNLKTALRFPHPWFGPLDAAGWHALVGTHLGIHRKQIERIVAGL